MAKRAIQRDFKLITHIIIHCSDSDLPAHDDVDIIKEWHLARGFTDVGYHIFVKKDGTIQLGRPLSQMGAHCITMNMVSIGICFSGRERFTDDQFLSAYSLVETLMNNYKIPKSKVLPHNHFNKNKTCPNFSLDKIWQFEKLS
jgi:N-acetyl-anhydromuramyl-L-alanine amidase AmpD